MKGAVMDIQLKTGCFEDAALVRRVVFMDEQGYENEFDAIDEDPNCIHVTLYVDGELAGCSRVFPEELERATDAERLGRRRRGGGDLHYGARGRAAGYASSWTGECDR